MGKVFQIVFAALSVALLSVGAARFYVQDKGLQVPVEVLTAFKVWKAKHQKFYATPLEEVHRSLVFFANYLKVKSHDISLGWTMALNGFADMDPKEFAAKYTGLNQAQAKTKNSKTFTPSNVGANPVTVDWRTQGAVNPIKNQGSCGSCWAFSANAAFESAAYIAGHNLISFSEQQLVECSWAEGNQGCNGGWMTSAYDYVIQAGGLESEGDYPYIGTDNVTCHSNQALFQAPQIINYVQIPADSCNLLETAVAQQPVTVAVDANAWQFYNSGIFNSIFCTAYLNHGVAAVGYSNEGTPYWIIRNSWGTGWGEQGYMRLNKATNSSGKGLCGVCMVTAYPEVAPPSSN